MKKTFRALVLMTFTLLTAAIMAFSVSASAPLPGDINGDGKVTVVDSIKILQYLANADVECVNSALDANGDNVIDGRDSTAILMNIVGWKKDLNYGDSCEHSLTSHPLAPAACTEPGSIEYVSCEKCNKLFLDNTCSVAITAKYTYIKPSGHVEVVDPYVSPTCGKVGSTEGSHCAVCSTVLTASNEVPATGKHDFSAVGNVWLDNVNYIEPVCSVCGTASGFRAEGGFDENTNTVFLRECANDFSFDIVCAENEAFIRDNLIIVESMFSSFEGEVLDAFENDYKLTKLGNDTWRVSPSDPYADRMGYDVILGDLNLAHFPGRSLSFKTAGKSADTAVYRNDILFLKTFEENDPGYYPYSIVFDDEAMAYTLTVSKTGTFTDALIGKVLCVGDCTNMETAAKLSSDEVDIGKITAIENTSSGAVITLGPVDFSDIYAELDVTLGDKAIEIDEELTLEERQLYVAALLNNESFLSTINTVEMAAASYATTYGASASEIDWQEIAAELVASMLFTCKLDSSATNTVLLTVGLEDFSIEIPIEYKDGQKLSSVIFTFTLKTDMEFFLNGEVSHTNVVEYLKDKFNIFEKDTTTAHFYTEIDTKNTVTFDFGITLKAEAAKGAVYYVVTPSTKKIHADFCKYATKYAEKEDCCFTFSEIQERYGDAYKHFECQSCKPFTENQNFVACGTTGIVHLNTCSHVPTINKGDLYTFSTRPTEGGNFGSTKFTYCNDCAPGNVASKTFDEYLKDSLNDADWNKQFELLQEKVADRLGFSIDPLSNSTKKVKIWIFEIGFTVTPVMNFSAEASVDFHYVDISKTKYTFELVYDKDLGKYQMLGNEIDIALTPDEKALITASLDIVGKVRAEAGIGFSIYMGPALVGEWFNINLYAEVGVYAELRGMVHLDFIQPQENFAAGYFDMGLYAEVNFGYTLFSYKPKKRIDILKHTEFSLYSCGDKAVYYGYYDYDQEVEIGYLKEFELKDELLKTLCYNLDQMKQEAVNLSFKKLFGDGYLIDYTITNINGKPLNYCYIEDGVFYVSNNAPAKFNAYINVSVVDTLKFNLFDVLSTGFGDSRGICYDLPKLTIKIIYDKNTPGSNGLEYSLNEDGKSYSVTGIGSCTDTDVVIPMKYLGLPVTSIGDYAFSGYSSLTSISIPNSITNIGEGTFFNCSSLTSISIPNSITNIGGNMFTGCSSLTSITIPDMVQNIGLAAFTDCSSLTTINIPKSVISIGDYSFMGCSLLKDVYYLGTVTDWSKISIGSENEYLLSANIHYQPDNNNDTASQGLEFTLNSEGTSYSVAGIGTCTDKDVIIPNKYNGLPVTSIANAAFLLSDIVNIAIPDSVTNIGSKAFFLCENLKSIIIPDSVTTIEFDTFYACTSLESVSLGCNIRSIGDYAFYSCSSLSSINIPNSVTVIGYDAFKDCPITSIHIPGSVQKIHNGALAFAQGNAKTKITLDKSNTTFHMVGSHLVETATKTLIYAGGTDSIPDDGSITAIASFAFYNCNELTELTIPATVIKMDYAAIVNCMNISEIYYSGTVELWNTIEKSHWFGYLDVPSLSLSEMKIICSDGVVKFWPFVAVSTG